MIQQQSMPLGYEPAHGDHLLTAVLLEFLLGQQPCLPLVLTYAHGPGLAHDGDHWSAAPAQYPLWGSTPLPKLQTHGAM